MTEKKPIHTYTIGELADLAGVSIRTLHYYDQIGLLKPSFRGANDYRFYEYEDLLKLQQILFFRELDMPLKKIKHLLDDPEINRVDLLNQHHQNLEKQIKRLKKLQTTITKTVQKLEKENKMPLTDKELYEGFSKEKIDRYNHEVRETYDSQMVGMVDQKVRSMSRDQWSAIKEEGGEIAAGLAKLINRPPTDPEVQALIKRHHAWIENFYPASAEIYLGLGDLYVTHEEFRAFYDQFAPNLSDFLKKAMTIYVDTVLSQK